MTEPLWQTPDFVEHYNRLYGVSEAQIRAFLTPLKLEAGDVVIDFGCGNGSILALAAPQVAFACGIDGSADQVELARRNLSGIANLEIQHSPFLEFRPPDRLCTKGWARKALHHLTDHEKGPFFRRMGGAFALGGLFLLEDGMFSFPREELDQQWPNVVREAEIYYGERWPLIRKDFEHTLRQEFPTDVPTWVETLRQGGLTLVEHRQTTCFYGSILARKETE